MVQISRPSTLCGQFAHLAAGARPAADPAPARGDTASARRPCRHNPPACRASSTRAVKWRGLSSTTFCKRDQRGGVVAIGLFHGGADVPAFGIIGRDVGDGLDQLLGGLLVGGRLRRLARGSSAGPRWGCPRRGTCSFSFSSMACASSALSAFLSWAKSCSSLVTSLGAGLGAGAWRGAAKAAPDSKQQGKDQRGAHGGQL